MLPYRDSRLTKIALGIFFIIVLSYAYYEARGLLYGPGITIPMGVTEVHEQFITIEGTADRIASITMNGKNIMVTEAGAFSEPYLLAPGYNRIAFEAKDKYGHSRKKIIEIVYTPDPSITTISIPVSATSTATTTPETASTTPVAGQ